MFAPIPVREMKRNLSYSVTFITQPHTFLRPSIVYLFQAKSQGETYVISGRHEDDRVQAA